RRSLRRSRSLIWMRCVLFMPPTVGFACVSAHHPARISRSLARTLAAARYSPRASQPCGGGARVATSVRRAGSCVRAGAGRAVVLEASVTPPRLRAEHIQRPRLRALLGEESARKVVLVAAPPGFGKSTFLAEWASANAQRVAWLSLDEHDNDPARF